MAEDGYITAEQAKAARAEPLTVTPRVLTPNSIAAGFFAEEVRRELSERYGEQKLYEGGLSVRTTLDPKMQLMARKALVDGLVRYDEAHGWHGTSRRSTSARTGACRSATFPNTATSSPGGSRSSSTSPIRRCASACSPNATSPARSGPERETGTVSADGMKWTAPDAEDAGQARRRRLRRAGGRQGRASSGCGRFPKCPAPASRWIRSPAACWRWSAASPTTSRNSIAPPRRSASPARRSSRSSTPRRSTTATRRPRSCSTSRSRSTRATAKSGRRRISRASRAVRTRCATASSIRSTR